MPHPLDRPIWNALTTRQSSLAIGNANARRFVPEIARFAAAADDGVQSLQALGALVPAELGAILLQAGDCPSAPGTTVVKSAPGVQMVAETIVPGTARFDFLELGDADAAEMLALATATEPGPFFARTHELGGFVGVQHGGRLVAMAGERLKPEGFTEVSGVCTHPAYRGRGYAGALMRVVAGRILDSGARPFLHAYASNVGAIGLYESLGFVVRCPVTMTMLARE